LLEARFTNGVHAVFHKQIHGVMECVMPQQLVIDQSNLMLILLDIINFAHVNKVQMLHFVMEHIGNLKFLHLKISDSLIS
jgi:hypothetical protein